MNANIPTSGEVRAKLGALNDLKNRLDKEAFDLALSAVSGEAAAVSRIAEIRAQIAGLDQDHAVLRQAAIAAERHEAAQREQTDEAKRKAALRRAEAAAKALIGECARVDAAIATVVSSIGAIGHLQLDLRSTLRAAGIDDAAGPSMLDVASNLLHAKLKGVFVSDDRPVGERAALIFEKFTRLLPEDGE
ncbi:hypothetical protein [Blastochloris tepida]|uniref:Uncharacterized protein n=1 Tax=Blastochloris tepida TaxID=2233851 RepID=A0A348FZW2_9HYPH|nr:hypothetical protein [Blastochloris tepida]BBF92845.1 hypothetical protein BLTE_15300 [Blastochloris tepida]